MNAGIARFAPWEQHSVDDFDRQFAVNVRGPWLAIKHAIPALNEGASVIATTSVVNQMGMHRRGGGALGLLRLPLLRPSAELSELVVDRLEPLVHVHAVPSGWPCACLRLRVGWTT